jgi:hypothetical protein
VADNDSRFRRVGWWSALPALILVAGAVLLLLSRGGSVTPTVAGSPPSFVEETASSGIDHTYAGEFEFFVGGGVAAFDCNGDGRQDLFFAGGSNRASLLANESAIGGELRFSRISDAATDLTQVLGAYPIDIDSDSHIDLVVLRLGENVVLRGLGGCRFERANETWQIDGGDDWTAAFSAKWEEPNSLPTLAFGNYLEWPVDRTQTATCADNGLLRPVGDGYGPAIPLAPGWCTLSILFADWDGSDRVDLRVANDRHYYVDGSEQLWEVAPGAQPRLYTAADGWNEIEIWGMGIASHDVTGDGLPEFFITSQGDNKLQALEGDAGQPNYGDIAIRRGVTAHRPFMGDEELPSTAWHPEFQDVNNDGFFDLFITKGNVESMAEYAMADPNNLLLGQTDGTFEESAVEAHVASLARSRGAALADFNLDGMLDLVVVNREERVQVWRNVGAGTAADPKPMGNWLALQLLLPGHNNHAIGAWVEVQIGEHVIGYEQTTGGGHGGDQLGWIHVGLGESSNADVRVTWPDGRITEWTGVKANSFVVLEIGQNPDYWEPAGP